jgi:calcium-dependent protein kinase
MVERMGDKEEIATIAEAFRALDADGDGAISLKELTKGYRKRMNTAKAKETAENVYKTIDFNNSGAINYSEFLLASINTEKLLSSANLRIVFDSFDKDKSGQISASELRELLMVDGAEQMEELWQQLISMTDSSGDGELDFDEFEDLMTRVMVK